MTSVTPLKNSSSLPNMQEHLCSLDDDLVKDKLDWLNHNEESSAFSRLLHDHLPQVNYESFLKETAQTCSTLQSSSDAFMKMYGDILTHSITSLDVMGLDQLDKQKNYVFISNHRDVLLDPLLINMALKNNNFPYARCAIGSNLLDDPLLGTYLRLSGCFVVPRDNLPMREMLRSLKILSSHIQHLSRSNNVWIAQREGRAKDGWDVTNPALIKMLLLSKDKATSISQHFDQHPVVPVSISYEWDPSDLEKAEELAIKEADKNAEYRSDSIKHLTNSLMSHKGHINVNFGAPLSLEESDTPDSISEKIDQHIQSHFYLYDSHIAAHKHKKRITLTNKEEQTLKSLEQRLGNLKDQKIKDNLLDLYANVAEQHLKRRGM